MNVINIISDKEFLTFIILVKFNLEIGDVNHLFFSDDNILFEH